MTLTTLSSTSQKMVLPLILFSITSFTTTTTNGQTIESYPWNTNININSVNTQQQEQQQSLTTTITTTTSTCHDILYSSDTNNDGRIQLSEYTDNLLVQLANTYFPSSSSSSILLYNNFNLNNNNDNNEEELPYNEEELPYMLRINYTHLSCRCKYYPINGGNECCQGLKNGIWLRSASSSSSSSATNQQQQQMMEEYLNGICHDTVETIRYEYNIGPTVHPTTYRPSSSQPTSSESTAVPTTSPIAIIANNDEHDDDESSSSNSCTNTPNYTDVYGDSCSFYEEKKEEMEQEQHPCLVYGSHGNDNPNDNCCVCKQMMSIMANDTAIRSRGYSRGFVQYLCNIHAECRRYRKSTTFFPSSVLLAKRNIHHFFHR